MTSPGRGASSGRRCIFCQILAGDAPASVVYRDDALIVFLDIRPLRPGHLLVVPTQHVERLPDVEPATFERLFHLGQQLNRALLTLEGIHGVNLLLNDGRAANQTVPHVHLHLVPRRRHDNLAMLWGTVTHLLGALVGRGPSPRRRQQLDSWADRVRHALADVAQSGEASRELVAPWAGRSSVPPVHDASTDGTRPETRPSAGELNP